ncbi:MAG: hypothetical protein HY735_01880 [Verrucomicrobia bacterium]|nr:hypothetical protein [Verrucomicrobiota bacterium]
MKPNNRQVFKHAWQSLVLLTLSITPFEQAASAGQIIARQEAREFVIKPLATASSATQFYD